MTLCHASAQLQDYLDGLLATGERVEFESHLEHCPHCAAELASYERVVSALGSVPLLELPAGLEARILAAVLPPLSQHRPAWVRPLGLAYAASLIVSLAALAAATLLPVPRALLQTVVASGMRSAVNALLFVLDALNATALRVVDVLGAIDGVMGRVAPLARTLAGSLSHPAVWMPAWGALLACAVVLWWMRPRDGRSVRGIRHVGLLGL